MNGVKSIILEGIESPIERGHSGRGRPGAVYQGYKALTNRQQRVLDMLPEYDCRAIVRKDQVSMRDLAVLTAKTGVEFAMFTCGPKRLVVRGDDRRVNVNPVTAAKLSAHGYKWSGHTHVDLLGGMEFTASDGDYEVLKVFAQKESVIYNVDGQYSTFENLLNPNWKR